MWLRVGWTEYRTTRVTVVLGWGWQLAWRIEDSFLTTDSCTYLHASRSDACMSAIARTCTWAKGMSSRVILFIAYSFSCDSFHYILNKSLQFTIKRISHSKPDLYMFLCSRYVISGMHSKKYYTPHQIIYVILYRNHMYPQCQHSWSLKIKSS